MEELGNSACMITTSELAIVGFSTTGTFNLLLYDWLINFIVEEMSRATKEG
jgi:hypothetical protein